MQPLYQEKAYEKDAKDQAICEFVFAVKEAFYTSEHFTFARQKAEVLKNLDQMVHAKNSKRTKYGFISGLVNGAKQSTLDTLEDLVDTDELVMTTAINRGGDNVKYAEDIGNYANNILVGCDYKQHLYERFQPLLIYGHSPAFDTWEYNQGWAVKAQAVSSGPGEFNWTREMDSTLNRAKPIAIHPFHVFGSVERSIMRQPHRGWIKRWSLGDVIKAEAKKTADGKPLYNPDAIKKMKEILSKGGQEADQYYTTDGKRDLDTSEISRNDKLKQSFIDIVYYKGPLTMVDGFRLDPNTYEIECTKNFLLRKTEQPVDTFQSITDMMTHPYMGSPFGGTFMDPIVGHQKIGDLVQNLMLENIVDSMHRFYTYRYEDITNIEDLKTPRGLQTFLELSTNGQPPALIEGSRSGPANDALAFLKLIDTDRQRVSVTDQETGLSQDSKTLGESKILLASSSKRVRAAVKRISTFAIIPQVKNLVFMSLVNQTPQQRRIYTRDGKEIQLTPAHAQAFFNNTLFRINDTVTRNKYEDNLKNAEFYINSIKILSQIQDPQYAIKVLRYLGKESGIKDIDEILPAPAVPDASAQPPIPGMPAMPPQGPQGAPPPGPQNMDFDQMINEARQPQPEGGLRVAA